MKYKENKLKGLLIDRTLDYIKNHEGKSNAKEVTARHSLRMLQRSFECISMEKFMEQQKDYISLSRTNEKMRERFRENAESMIGCYPRQTLYHDSETMNEENVYLLIEILEGKHNEFLQRIIDRTKDK